MPTPDDFNVILNAFTTGEVSPRLFGRTDLAKYALGAARMRNIYPDIRGAANTRAGTKMIAAAGDSTHLVIVRSFSFSVLQTYVLEIGHLYMRFITRGAQITSSSVPYQITTPWPGDQTLRELRFSQSADTMTVCHPSYQPYDVTRTGDAAWTLTGITFGTRTPSPSIVAVTNVVGGTTIYRYVVTAMIGPDESIPSAAGQVTAATMSQNGLESVLVRWTAVAGAQVYQVYRQAEVPGSGADLGSLYGLVGSTQGLTFTDHNVTPDYSQCPEQIMNPFAGGAITSVTVTSGGGGYSIDTYMTITDPTGAGFRGFPVIVGGVITGVVIQQGGWLYTSPTLIFTDPAGGAGAVAAPPSVTPPPPVDPGGGSEPVPEGGQGGDGGSGG